MLKQRVTTALLLAPLVVLLVFYLPTGLFGIVLALFFLLASEEMARMVGVGSCGANIGFLIANAGGMALMGWLMHSGQSPQPLFLLAAFWWILQLAILSRLSKVEKAEGLDRSAYFSSTLILVSAWAGLVWLHGLEQGAYWVMALLLSIWAADSLAYFSGRRWGNRKLAPVVSPGKTWAGAYGALAGGLIWGLVVAWGLGQGIETQVGLVLLCVLIVPISILGDLYESYLKRRRGIKDSGDLLPGHGGIMDRIDSLLAASPFFALGLMWLGAGS